MTETAVFSESCRSVELCQFYFMLHTFKLWSLNRKGEMSYYSSSRSSSRATDCKVYVGDLGNGAAKGELERAFSYYGPLRSVWVARNPPGFAFVEFEDPRDAEDAVKGMDGK